MSLRSILIKKKNLTNNEGYCSNCLWLLPEKEMCVHYKHPQNITDMAENNSCDWKFDLILGRDYDIEVVQWYKQNIPKLVKIDEKGKEFI